MAVWPAVERFGWHHMWLRRPLQPVEWNRLLDHLLIGFLQFIVTTARTIQRWARQPNKSVSQPTYSESTQVLRCAGILIRLKLLIISHQSKCAEHHRIFVSVRFGSTVQPRGFIQAIVITCFDRDCSHDSRSSDLWLMRLRVPHVRVFI